MEWRRRDVSVSLGLGRDTVLFVRVVLVVFHYQMAIIENILKVVGEHETTASQRRPILSDLSWAAIGDGPN